MGSGVLIPRIMFYICNFVQIYVNILIRLLWYLNVVLDKIFLQFSFSVGQHGESKDQKSSEGSENPGWE